MRGLLNLLSGAADQLDFIPGFDPRKDQQGMISKLMSGGQKPAGQSYQPQLDAVLSQAGPTFERARQAPSGMLPQASRPAMPKMPMPADYTTPLNFLDVLNPFKDTQNIRANDQARLNEAYGKYNAANARAASQQADAEFIRNAQQSGFSPAEIARMNIARNANPEEFGKSFAGNFGFNSVAEGNQYSRFGGDMQKVDKTFTPVAPSKLEIDQQNADSAALTAEAAMLRAQTPSGPLVEVTNNPTPEQYAESLMSAPQAKGEDSAVVFDENGQILVSPNQQQSTFGADALKFNEMNAKFDLAAQEIDRAIAFIDSGGAAGASSFTQNIPIVGGQTPAGGLANSLMTIKSRIGFDELQAMREASPTGGALGQVSEREIDFLQSLMGSLAQDQKPNILRENLVTIRNFLAGRQGRYERAFNTKYPTLEQNMGQRDRAERSIDDLLNIYGGDS